MRQRPVGNEGLSVISEKTYKRASGGASRLDWQWMRQVRRWPVRALQVTGELVSSMQVCWSSLLYVDVKGGSRDSWASICSCPSAGAVMQEQGGRGLARIRGEMALQVGSAEDWADSL